jgi:hypothetical protein
MFIVSWLFDKLGYMPKIDVEVGVVKSEFKAVWPFPEETAVAKPTVKKATTRTTKKPAVVAKTTRTKKVK